MTHLFWRKSYQKYNLYCKLSTLGGHAGLGINVCALS
jgi:hypothetical protein